MLITKTPPPGNGNGGIVPPWMQRPLLQPTPPPVPPRSRDEVLQLLRSVGWVVVSGDDDKILPYPAGR